MLFHSSLCIFVSFSVQQHIDKFQNLELLLIKVQPNEQLGETKQKAINIFKNELSFFHTILQHTYGETQQPKRNDCQDANMKLFILSKKINTLKTYRKLGGAHVKSLHQSQSGNLISILAQLKKKKKEEQHNILMANTFYFGVLCIATLLVSCVD